MLVELEVAWTGWDEATWLTVELGELEELELGLELELVAAACGVVAWLTVELVAAA